MKKFTYPLILLPALLCFLSTPVGAQPMPAQGSAPAQHDSSRLDLGYTSLNRKFTQTITIRGADLEKMPFTNLNDALMPWLYGAWSQRGSIQFVVDGNPVVDVNAYSIYDVEEVVLVQDASALTGSGTGQQQVAYVTTRRGKNKQGLTLAAQTGLVNGNGNGVKTDTRMYHSYYAGAWRNWDKFSAGVSAGWQRDVMPLEKSEFVNITTPYNLQRWKFSGYFDWRLNARNLVEATINYVPDRLAVEGGEISSFTLKRNAPEKYFVPGLRWHSELLPGLKNDLQGSYLSSVYKENDINTSPASYPAGSYQNILIEENMNDKLWWVRDRLAYTIHSGDWRFEPSVNYSYEHVKETFGYIGETTITTGGNPSLPPPTGTNTTNFSGKGKISLLVSALDINWKDVLNLRFGSATILSDHGGKGDLPFFTAAVDLLRMTGSTNNSSSLKLLGSWSQRSSLTIGSGLSDLSNENTIYKLNIVGGSGFQSVNFGTGTAFPVNPFHTPPNFWSWTAGASYSLANDRLRLQYTLERRNIDLAQLLPIPGGGYATFYGQWRSTLHHFDVRAKLLDREGLRWETGLNLTLFRNKPDSALQYTITVPPLGDAAPAGYSPTGGWVNRLQLKGFTAGLDLLYHFHETVYITSQTTQHVNSVIIPNLYAGYNWHSFSLFAECRGLIRNSKQDVMDTRKYYTLGGKWNL